MNRDITVYIDLDSGKTMKTIHRITKKKVYDTCRIGGEWWIVLKKESRREFGAIKTTLGIKKMPENHLRK